MITAWLIAWTVVLGHDDPRLVRTIIEVPTGAAKCLEVVNNLIAVGRLEGNLLLEASCVRERPRAVRKGDEA